MKHVIRTQVFEVVTTIKEETFELQQKMSEIFHSVILPVIERTFDELAPGEQYIYLDRIEIDLGKIQVKDLKLQNWETEFRELFSKQFIDQVNMTIEKKSGMPLSYSIAQQWIFYMRKGYLPWNATSTNEFWYLKVLEGLAQDYKTAEELRELIRKDRRALRRIVMQHDVSYLVHLVEVLTAVKQEELKEWTETIIRLVLKHQSSVINTEMTITLVRRIWEAVFEAIVDPKKLIQSIEIISEVIPRIFTYSEIVFLQKHSEEKELLPLFPVINRIISNGPEVFQRKKEVKEPVIESGRTYHIRIPEEGLFVSNAGLVILHPFLDRFFTYLQLVNDHAFINEMKRQQAVILLHYLVTGKPEFNEHELVIAKCLCNYSFEETVDPLHWPTIAMINECDELLKDVIAQWTVLKNTTPEGIRLNFLQRPGKLYTKNSEPYLMVEANVIDVLLDRLPWGIGTIKLPWMEKVLRVEWR